MADICLELKHPINTIYKTPCHCGNTLFAQMADDTWMCGECHADAVMKPRITTKSQMKRIATVDPIKAAEELERLRELVREAKSCIERRMASDESTGMPFDEDFGDWLNRAEKAVENA